MPSLIINILTFFILPFILIGGDNKPANDFQGKATYISKSRLELGRWGARMSEAQKKQIARSYSYIIVTCCYSVD